jgi:8-oxo-dGTP diphosphatase
MSAQGSRETMATTARTIRYQGAILGEDGRILLIQQCEHATGRTYWLIPGGRREANESEEECVRREMREETNLDVIVEDLLLDEPGSPGGMYERQKTYRCRSGAGVAQPGYEPEPEFSANYTFTAVGWWDLYDEGTWDALILNDPITTDMLRRVRAALG